MVSASLALPAAAAGLAYVDAKYMVSHDVSMIWSRIRGVLAQKRAAKTGRYNCFYIIEDRALDPKTASNTFLIYQGQQWTYRQAYELILKHGTWLKRTYSIGPGEVIALDCMNGPAFLWFLFGLFSIGAKAALINYNLTGKPLYHSVKSSGARLMLVEDEIKDAVCTPEVLKEFSSNEFREGAGPLTLATITESLEQEIALVEPVREPDLARKEVDGNALSVLIYTSGTTGLPKPAYISCDRLIAAGVAIGGLLGLKQADRFYTCMPLYHSAGLALGLFTTISTGSTLVVGRKFSTKTFWRDVVDSKATVIQYVGETCRYLLAAPPSQLDRAHNVRMAFGNGLRPDIWSRFKDRFNIGTIMEFYGATELSGSSWNYSRGDFTKGSIGRSGLLVHMLFGGAALIVEVDPATDEPARDLQTGFCKRIDTTKPGAPPGEMLYILPEDEAEAKAQFQGYYKNDKATNSKILRNVLVKGDKYVRSGDLIRRDPEGRNYFIDRIGDTFRWRSENVSTNEVADVLGGHKDIAVSNVYGVEVPNHDGRAGCAALVMHTGTQELSAETLQSLASHATRALPKYAVPIFLRHVMVMENTGTNKQVKHVMRGQGINPATISGGDRMFWLQKGTYVPFGEKEYARVTGGQVKL